MWLCMGVQRRVEVKEGKRLEYLCSINTSAKYRLHKLPKPPAPDRLVVDDFTGCRPWRVPVRGLSEHHVFWLSEIWYDWLLHIITSPSPDQYRPGTFCKYQDVTYPGIRLRIKDVAYYIRVFKRLFYMLNHDTILKKIWVPEPLLDTIFQVSSCSCPDNIWSCLKHKSLKFLYPVKSVFLQNLCYRFLKTDFSVWANKCNLLWLGLDMFCVNKIISVLILCR